VTALFALLAAPTAYASAVGIHLTLARHRYRQVSPDGEPPPPGALIAEVRRKWLVRSWSVGTEVPPPGLTADPVLLVHGFVGRPSHFRGLQRFLHGEGHPTQTVNIGWKFVGVESYAPPLVEALKAHPRVRIVAHSMGGVVLRHVLHTHPELRDRITHAVTLGTPHSGTAAADVPLNIPGDVGQLAPDSAFLTELPELFELLPRAHKVAIGAQWDVTVFPIERALPEGMHHVVLPGYGHMGLLTETSAHRAVLEAITTG
jgi:pimeloyl-ACP methyl ester carboxylesterase